MEKSRDALRNISEVADWVGVPTHVLRFWESQFAQVRPIKRAGGRRYYRPSDMALLGGIRKLLHDDGMTIRGVRKFIRERGAGSVAALAPTFEEETRDIEVGIPISETEDLTATSSIEDDRPEPTDRAITETGKHAADTTPTSDETEHPVTSHDPTSDASSAGSGMLRSMMAPGNWQNWRRTNPVPLDRMRDCLRPWKAMPLLELDQSLLDPLTLPMPT